MTLIALWHPESGSLQVASDSRATFDCSFADIAVKITEIDLRIFASTPAGSPEDFEPDLLIERTLGLSVVGSLTSTLTCASVLRPILGGLQIAEGLTDYSLVSVAKIVGAVFERVAKEVCQAIFEKGEGAIVLIGKCPLSGDVAAYKITVDSRTGALASSVERLPVGTRPIFLGSESGRQAAENLLARNPKLIGFRVVRQVCDDENVSSVGGNVQFGAVDGDDFRTWGVHEFEVDDASRIVRTGFFVAGVELFGPNDALSNLGFVPRHPFVSPFRPDIELLIRRGYTVGSFGES